MIYKCLDNLILFLWYNIHLWIMLKTQVNLVFIVSLVISVLMMMMVNTYCTEEEDHAAEWKTTGITKITWNIAKQVNTAPQCCCPSTRIQAWIPATINAWAKKRAVITHLRSSYVPTETRILTRSTWFNYYEHVKTRKRLLLSDKHAYCFIWEQNVLLKCLNWCSVIWTNIQLRDEMTEVEMIDSPSCFIRARGRMTETDTSTTK